MGNYGKIWLLIETFRFLLQIVFIILWVFHQALCKLLWWKPKKAKPNEQIPQKSAHKFLQMPNIFHKFLQSSSLETLDKMPWKLKAKYYTKYTHKAEITRNTVKLS